LLSERVYTSRSFPITIQLTISFHSTGLLMHDLRLLENLWLLLLHATLVELGDTVVMHEARARKEVGKSGFAVNLGPALLLALCSTGGAKEGVHFFLGGSLANNTHADARVRKLTRETPLVSGKKKKINAAPMAVKIPKKI